MTDNYSWTSILMVVNFTISQVRHVCHMIGWVRSNFFVVSPTLCFYNWLISQSRSWTLSNFLNEFPYIFCHGKRWPQIFCHRHSHKAQPVWLLQSHIEIFSYGVTSIMAEDSSSVSMTRSNMFTPSVSRIYSDHSP